MTVLYHWYFLPIIVRLIIKDGKVFAKDPRDRSKGLLSSGEVWKKTGTLVEAAQIPIKPEVAAESSDNSGSNSDSDSESSSSSSSNNSNTNSNDQDQGVGSEFWRWRSGR